MATTVAMLKKSRASIKGKLTRFDNFVNDITNSETSEEDLGILRSRLNEAKSFLGLFNGIQDKIEETEIDEDEQVPERDRFETDYHQYMAKAQSCFGKRPITDASSSSGTQPEASVRLPPMDLPTFDGNIEQWLSFHDTFKTLIHDNSTLTSVQKSYYLRSVLRGPAAEVIQSLKTSHEYYQIAWDLLDRRYNNVKLIKSSHIQALLDIPVLRNDADTSIRQMLDGVQRHTRALEVLKANTWDSLLTHLMEAKMDKHTKREWKTFIKDKPVTSVEDLTSFLEERCSIVQSSSNVLTSNDHWKHSKPEFKPRKNINVLAYVTNATTNCVTCKEMHHVFQCPTFRNFSLQARRTLVQTHKLCANCLRAHQGGKCKSGPCKQCQRYHHTMLHDDQRTSSPKFNGPSQITRQQPTAHPKVDNIKDSAGPVALTQHNIVNPGHVLLSTALILVKGSDDRMYQCRALLDSGAQTNIISKELCERIRIPTQKIDLPIGGLNNIEASASERLKIEITSRFGSYHTTLDCFVVDKIVSLYPAVRVDVTRLRIPPNLTLADPTFDRPGTIDCILGSGIFWHLLCVGQIKLDEGQPIMHKTQLGWIIAGPLFHKQPIHKKDSTFCGLTSIQHIDEQLKRFWEIEEYTDKVHRSSEEEMCETHFVQTHTRAPDGRFTVLMPIRDNMDRLGKSEEIAKKRLYAIERKLAKHPHHKQQYAEFLQEYLSLGHMTDITDHSTRDNRAYYIPHHYVTKESSSTTKLRVVFDASCKTFSGVSLNDVLMTGPTIQQDLFSIVLRFRQHAYVLSADIEKMYRQANVTSDQRHLQQITETPNEPIRTFALNTITYGLASSPFLAIRCVYQLGIENEEHRPRGSEIIKTDFYVDDLLSGADSLQEARSIKKEVTEILSTGKFNLCKWVSNETTLMDSEGDTDSLMHKVSADFKTLGLVWDPRQDILHYSVNVDTDTTRITKRVILSTISQIFDPLGLVGPAIIQTKILLQGLWSLKLGWDESVPLQIHTAWKHYIQQLHVLRDIRIPRLVKSRVNTVEVHGFCDASERAYGACVYVRSSNEDGTWTSTLLCAKSKVAPLKNLTIPRLELCGALLLARLCEKVRRALTVTVTSTHYWCDSTISLAWIKGEPNRWKVFVAHRVAEIQERTDPQQWKHVRSEDNPADLISRGTDASQLQHALIWWHEPSWLTLNQEQWPVSSQVTPPELPEERQQAFVSVVTIDNSLFERFSSLSKLTRVHAYCERFIANVSKGQNRRSGPLSVEELDKSLKTLIKLAQQQTMSTEIAALKSGRELPRNSKIYTLNPFIDDSGLLRIGGRLRHSELEYARRHSITLPEQHTLTKLIVRDAHYRQLHCGTQALLTNIRLRFWILGGRNTVRSVLRQCIVCFKSRPVTASQLMGDLPAARVTPSRPFSKCGVDYAGPFTIKISRNKNSKAYLCLFICLATKAIHLELVSDLTTNAFLNSLKRFVARRGKPTDIFSDNGTNFVGARNELSQLHEFVKSNNTQGRIYDFSSEQGINWHFIPAHSPHFGGLWEAGVKSVKTHSRRIVGNIPLYFEELHTVFSLIEACVNSRPLVPLSDDPTDLCPLTPGHFLIGQPLTAVPEQNLLDVPMNRLTKYQLICQIQQQFWKRWNLEYLNQLQQRSKWNRKFDHSSLHGRLVILKEDNLPPMQWRMGRIVEVHPGKDGLIRVVSIKTQTSTLKRAVNKICLLPITE